MDPLKKFSASFVVVWYDRQMVAKDYAAHQYQVLSSTEDGRARFSFSLIPTNPSEVNSFTNRQFHEALGTWLRGQLLSLSNQIL